MPVLPFSFARSSSGDTSDTDESDADDPKNTTKAPCSINPTSIFGKFLNKNRPAKNNEDSTSYSSIQSSSTKLPTDDGLFLVDTSTSCGNMAIKQVPISKIRNDLCASSSLDAGNLFNIFSGGMIQGQPILKQTADGAVESRVAEAMKKSVITEEFLKKDKVPCYEESRRVTKKKRQAEREKTKGKGWHDFPATELTEERKRDLEIMQIRNSLDPKQFYRREDRKVLPKYFQIGTVIEDPSDYYTDRIPKKQRKQTIVDELLADAELQQYNKKKYKEIISEKYKNQSGNRKRYFKPSRKTK